jgi:hypothetical protein
LTVEVIRKLRRPQGRGGHPDIYKRHACVYAGGKNGCSGYRYRGGEGVRARDAQRDSISLWARRYQPRARADDCT